MDPTCGAPCVSRRGESSQFSRRRNSEKKMYDQEYAKAFGLTGSGEGQGGLRGTSGPSLRIGPV
jgi:hypothetical protein